MNRIHIRKALINTLWIIGLLTACKTEKPEIAENAPNIRPLSTREAQIVSSSNNFAFDLLKNIEAKESNKNFFVSPLSISMALTMVYNGAGTTTKEAIRHTLGFTPGSDEDINQSFRSVSQLLSRVDQTVNFKTANSIWHTQQITLQPDFTSTNQHYFDARVQGLDFAHPATKDIINTWVKEKTEGRIEKVVEEITPDHLLFLINAIYFKGDWTYAFDKKLTKQGSFHLEDGSSKTVNMMALKKARYLLYQDEDKIIVDLPYGNKQFSMTLIVPGQDKTLADISGELSVHALQTWLSKADSASLELYMPKFTLEYEIKLRETLAAMGMAEAFGKNADFSKMIDGISQGIAINEVTHKTFVEVHEEGTEAAAVTSIDIVLTSMPPSLRIDKPFIFLIREKSSDTILFIGKMVNP